MVDVPINIVSLDVYCPLLATFLILTVGDVSLELVVGYVTCPPGDCGQATPEMHLSS